MCGLFQNRKFRRLFVGRTVTNVGDSLYFVAAMWLVHELTSDPFYTGLAGFLTLLPGAFQFLAGPLVDRWPIRRTLVGTQVVQAVLVLLVPIADLYGVLTVEVVLVVMPILATLNEFANPAMVAALPRILDEDELVGANSAFSVASQGMDMIGYGGAGLIMGVTGAVALFAFDAITFAFASILFATVVVPPAGASETESRGNFDADRSAVTDGGQAKDDESYLDELRFGVDYIRNTVVTWLVVGVVVLNSTAGMALAVMPSYADSLGMPAIFGALGGAGAYGVLMASFATGNLLGAIAANLVDDHPFGWTMIVGFTFAAICWTAAIVVGWLPATAALLALAFVPIGIINVQNVALVQSGAPEEVVGRVSSVLGSISVAALPVGSLLGGALAGEFDPQMAMSVVGLGLVGMAVYVFAVPQLRTLPRIEQVSI